MPYFSFPPPTTCEFCGTTQNGMCLRRACIDARLDRAQSTTLVAGNARRLPHASKDLLGAPLKTHALPSGYASECATEAKSICIRVRKHGLQVGFIEAVLKEEQGYCYYYASRLYVEKKHRHLGIGRALVHMLLDACGELEIRGVAQSFGKEPIGKRRIIQFYRRCGARVSRHGAVTWLPGHSSIKSTGTIPDSSYQLLCVQVRQIACTNGWVAQEQDAMYAWEQTVVDWLVRYRPHLIASLRPDEQSIMTALSEVDTLLLWGRQRS